MDFFFSVAHISDFKQLSGLQSAFNAITYLKFVGLIDSIIQRNIFAVIQFGQYHLVRIYGKITKMQGSYDRRRVQLSAVHQNREYYSYQERRYAAKFDSKSSFENHDLAKFKRHKVIKSIDIEGIKH